MLQTFCENDCLDLVTVMLLLTLVVQIKGWVGVKKPSPWRKNVVMWKSVPWLTDAVAKHTPQSTTVSTVMLSNARRIMGTSDCHRADTLWNGQCLEPRIIPAYRTNPQYSTTDNHWTMYLTLLTQTSHATWTHLTQCNTMSHLPLTTDTGIQFQVSPHWIFGKKKWHWDRSYSEYFTCTLSVSFHHCSTFTP